MNPVIHFEMPANDRQRMSVFYSKAFGWKTEQLGPEMGNYVLANTTETNNDRPITPGTINGGFYQRTPEMGPIATSLVISVEDIRQHIEIVKQAGGKIMGEVQEIPGVGKWVSFVDTEGNRMGMMQKSKDGMK